MFKYIAYAGIAIILLCVICQVTGIYDVWSAVINLFQTPYDTSKKEIMAVKSNTPSTAISSTNTGTVTAQTPTTSSPVQLSVTTSASVSSATAPSPVASNSGIVIASPIQVQATSATVPSITTQSISAPIDQPAAPVNMPIPSWMNKCDGQLTTVKGVIYLMTLTLQPTAAVDQVTFTGSGISTLGNLTVSGGQLKTGLITVTIKTPTMTQKFTGQQVDQLTDSVFKDTLQLSTYNTANPLNIPRSLQGYYIFNCVQVPMKVDKFMIYKDNVAISGTDDNGEYTITGKITDKSAILTKQSGQDSIKYEGSYLSGVLSGRWTNGDFSNEFAFYEMNKPYQSPLPLYGGGCKYASTWKGTFDDTDGSKVDIELTNLKVDEFSFLTANSSDKYGPATLTGYLVGNSVVLNKQYTGGSIEYRGTLSMSEFKGQWVYGDNGGSFIIKPVV